MRIALAQIASGVDPDGNLALIREHAARAADAGVRLLVFPEAAMASFATRSADVAQPLDGPWADGVREAASRHGLTVVAGMFTPAAASVGADGKRRSRARNTLLVTGAGVDAHYDKLHLYDAWGFVESQHVEAGDTVVAVDVDGVRVGLTTCYDVRFPELFKYHASHGAEVIVVPASWANGPGKVEQWRALCVARALDSTCFIAAAAQADPATVPGREVRAGSPTGVGHSLVVGPLGRVLAEAGAGPELLVADLDVASLADARAQLPVLATSRFAIVAPGS